MAHSIYLSFAPEDSPVANELASYIQSRDLVPVLSNQMGPAGEPVMIVLFTDYTNTCDTILNDFKIATTRRIPIVGLRIAASFLNNEIESLNPHVEWITSIIGNPNNHFPKLIDQVAIHLQGVHVAAHLETSSTYQHQQHVHQEPKAEIRPVRSDDAPPVVVTAPKPTRAPEHETYTVVLLDRGNAIETIALVRELTGLGLKESKDLVDSVPVNIAVAKSLQEAEGYATYLASSGARTRVQPRNAPDEIAPQSALNAPPMIVDAGPMFDVILRSPGTNKLILIKIIRQMTGLGLSECKELVEGPMPQTLARVGTIEEATKLRDLLYASGAMADALEATPATAPHFVRRPLPPQGCATTALGVLAALLVFGAFLVR